MTKDPLLAIKTKLLADTRITALVGTRVYVDIPPASPTFPLIILMEITDTSDDDSNTSNNAHVRIQTTASCQGIGSGEARAISRTIRTVLHKMTNTILSSGTDPVYVISCMDAGFRPGEPNTAVSPIIWPAIRDFLIEYNSN